MKPFISKHINLLKQAEQDIKDAKIGISRHDRQKMQLWEALFIPKKSIQDKLMTLKYAASQGQWDVGNSVNLPTALYNAVDELYNDPTWVVYSRVLPDFSEKLEKPVRLELGHGESITPLRVKKLYCSTKGELNKALSRWKRSGNGSGNRNTRFKNVQYESDDINAGEQDDIEFVEDDHHSFIRNLHVGYFWNLAEVTHLTNHISQNCSAISMNANNKHTLTSTRGNRMNKKGKAKRQKMEKQSEMLITMVGNLSKGMNEQSDTFKLSSLTASVSEAEKGISKQ
jgi:hypothetical protein